MVPDWAVSVMFYGLLLLIISALIAEFRGTLGSGDAAADAVRDDEVRLSGDDGILVDLASEAGLLDDRAEDP
jgi:hypothetical protein